MNLEAKFFSKIYLVREAFTIPIINMASNEVGVISNLTFQYIFNIVTRLQFGKPANRCQQSGLFLRAVRPSWSTIASADNPIDLKQDFKFFYHLN